MIKLKKDKLKKKVSMTKIITIGEKLKWRKKQEIGIKQSKSKSKYDQIKRSK